MNWYKKAQLEYYHGSYGIFNSSAEMPEGHRGYFATTSPEVAHKFGPNLHKIILKTNRIFNPLTDEINLDIFAEKLKHLNTLNGKEGIKEGVREGNYGIFENWQAMSILKDLGFDGNYQKEDGEPVIRLFNKKNFDIKYIGQKNELV